MSDLDETERADPRFRDLEMRSPAELLATLLEGQARANLAVETALPSIEAAAIAVTGRIAASPQSRLVYAGAGTSGRLAMLDGVELGPTFGWPTERTEFLLAGGTASLSRAREGAEDDRTAAVTTVREAGIGRCDVVIALAASGRTPFTCEIAAASRAAGALVITLANNPDTPLLRAGDHAILLRTGSEVLAGSTRMAAGTAQKIALNLLSTAVMVGLGKVFRGRMIDMHPTNRKLRRRAARMIADVTGCGEGDAIAAMEVCEGDIRAAMLRIESGG